MMIRCCASCMEEVTHFRRKRPKPEPTNLIEAIVWMEGGFSLVDSSKELFLGPIHYISFVIVAICITNHRMPRLYLQDLLF